MTTAYDLVAGDTLSFGVTAPTAADGSKYAASDGWALTYKLIPRTATNAVITLSALSDGDDFSVEASATTTAAYAPDWYSVAAYVTKGAETYTVEPAFGQARILANPRTAVAGFDGRSDAQKAYDDACQALRDAASRSATGSAQQVLRYRIGDREMEYGSVDKAIAGLLQLKNAAALELKREHAANARLCGEANPAHFYTRVGRV